MGIVYLAEDTKLDRQVAIKVLPSSALASEDDRARFYREAKAAAALNHPNIAQIYQIDEAVPSDAPHGTQPSPFIAMEYIDGETLDARIQRGPLKLKEAVRLATQIAGALGEAHDKGIVHRDVKASNVMLTSKDDAKVLDFGLALTAASTKLTRMGSTLGTVAYMSPEQARGEDVDNRTDLWALGVVFYEMVAGRNPFGGDYEQAVVYSILNAEPEPLTAVRTGVPMELERIVTKSLAKDPDLRYQTATGFIADLKALDLSGSGQSRSSMSATSAASAAPTDSARSRVRVSRWLPGGIGAAILALGVALGAIFFGRSSTDRLSQAPVRTHLILDQPGVAFPRLSEDGRYLAFEGMTSSDEPALFLYDLVAGVQRHFPAGGWVDPATFSPDGRWLVWLQGGKLWKAQTTGGAALELGPECRSPVFIDNEQFICRSLERSGYGLPLIASDLDGITSEPLILPDSARGMRALTANDILPGRRFMVGSIITVEDEDELAVFDLRKGSIQRLNQSGRNVRYVASGHLFFVDDIDNGGYGIPMARPFDMDSRRFTGPAAPVSDERVWAWNIDVTDSGFLVSDESEPGQDRTVFEWWDLGGERLGRIPLDPDDYETMVLSPDGRRLAVKLEDDPNRTKDVFIIDATSGTRSRLSFTGETELLAWSADGSKVYMQAYFEGMDDAVVVKPADGSGSMALFPDSVSYVRYLHEARNGSTIAYVSDGDLVLRSLTSPDSVRIIEREGSILSPVLSNDGTYVAYTLREQNRSTVYVQQVRGDAFWTVPTSGQASTYSPEWSADGTWLYYENGEQLWRARVAYGPTFAFEETEYVLDLPSRTWDYKLHPDGERVLFLRAVPADSAQAEKEDTRLSLRINLGSLLNEIAPPSE